MKCFFWHGVRILGMNIGWIPTPIPGSPVERQGTSRRMAKLSGRSRNYLWDVTTLTQVGPETAMEGLSDPALDAGRQLAFNLDVVQFFELMLQHSFDLGDLSWVEDDTNVVVATGAGGTYPGTLTVTYASAPWTIAVGQWVLARNPVTGSGFVREVTMAAAGTFALDSAPLLADSEEPAAGWEFYLVAMAFPDTIWMQPSAWEISSQADNCWADKFELLFKSQAERTVRSTVYDRDIG